MPGGRQNSLPVKRLPASSAELGDVHSRTTAVHVDPESPEIRRNNVPTMIKSVDVEILSLNEGGT